MDIISALFTENINLRQVPGPSTRIDLSGIMFSLAAPSEPPVTIGPHLVVIVRCRENEPGDGILEVVFKDEKGEEVARNVSPFTVEPGKFTYRLVPGPLTVETSRTIRGPSRGARGASTVVPPTLIPAPEARRMAYAAATCPLRSPGPGARPWGAGPRGGARAAVAARGSEGQPAPSSVGPEGWRRSPP